MWKKILKKWLPAACALLLSACSYISTGSIELLQAPIINQRQAELQEALKRTLDLSDIVFHYPRSGEYRSPFLFRDLDGDGLDEAVVLYAYADRADEVRATMLRQTADGEWAPFYDIAGKGNQVEFVEFSHLLSKEHDCMMIGWNNTARNTVVLEVFSLVDGAFNQQVQRESHGHAIADFSGDGLAEIVLITPTESRQGLEALLLQGADNQMRAVSALPLEPDAEAVLQLLQGNLWDGSPALYVDTEHDNGTVGTEVIRVSDGALHPVAASQSPRDSAAYASYASTFRGEKVLCVDIFEDRTIEVPRMQELPSSSEGDDPETLELTEYRHLGAGGYESAYYAAVNEEAGYLFFFPERWLGHVTVISRPEIREWQFHRVDPVSQLPVQELFRIRVYVAGDYQDRFTQSYRLLETKGIFSYYGYIPPLEGVGDPLALTQQEAEQLLLLL